MLAWLGGVAVLAGLAFLLTIAVSRGWIGEGARTALAGDALARPARHRRLAARAARTAPRPRWPRPPSASPGSFATLVVAGPVYDLVPRRVALLGAFVDRRRRHRARHPLARAGDGLARAARRAAGRRLRSARSTAAGSLPGDRLRRDRRRARVAALDRARRASPSSTATLQWRRAGRSVDERRRSRWSCFGVLAAALAFGFEANRRGLRRSRSARGAHAPVVLAVALLAIDAALLALAGWDVLDGEPGWSRSRSPTSRSASPPPASRASRASSR